MGASHRAAHALEPGNCDLLVPARVGRRRQMAVRDVVDADFETVLAPRDVPAARPYRARSHGAFRSGLTDLPAEGPFPRDFAPQVTVGKADRLGVFSAATSARPKHQSGAHAAGGTFMVLVCVAAATVFWMAGGYSLTGPGATEASRSAATAAAFVPVRHAISVVPVEPDPLTTASVPDPQAAAEAVEVIRPSPRPARIERAGSILMIRPGG